MITNPDATTVLCYGDSNTWGQKPDKSGRFAADVRWTGLLQKSLSDSYYIIEEGLGSRTTNLDYDKKPGRNGKAYLIPCLDSHAPLDIVVLMLGTNDLKIQFRRTAREIAQAITELVEDIRLHSHDTNGNPTRIILVSPILINDQAPLFAKFYTGYYNERSAQESQKLAAAISEVAEQVGCDFVDAASVSEPGEDGIHFSVESEAPLAKLLQDTIQKATSGER